MHSLYRSSTRGPEDDSVESKHVAPLSHYILNFTTVVFDGTSPPILKEVFMSHYGSKISHVTIMVTVT